MRIGACSALVTGGASGLGAAAARRLRAEGARVVIADRDGEAARELAAALGPGAEAVEADVRDERDLRRAVAVAAGAGPLRVAVACAGVPGRGRVLGRAGPLPLAVFADAVAVNLTGTFNLLRLAAAEMAGAAPDPDRHRGVVLMTASAAAFEGQVGQAAYRRPRAASSRSRWRPRATWPDMPSASSRSPRARWRPRWSRGSRTRRSPRSRPRAPTRRAWDARRSSPRWCCTRWRATT